MHESVCAKVTGKQNSTLTVLVCVNGCVLLPLFRSVCVKLTVNTYECTTLV